MGLFGGGNSSTTSNTTNTSTQTTNTQITGLTGEAYAQTLGQLNEIASNVFAGGYNTINNAFAFGQYTVDRNLQASTNALNVVDNTAANLINASRDFAQRAISGSTGQSTPIQTIGGADTVANQQASNSNSTLLLILAIAGIGIALLKG